MNQCAFKNQGMGNSRCADMRGPLIMLDVLLLAKRCIRVTIILMICIQCSAVAIGKGHDIVVVREHKAVKGYYQRAVVDASGNCYWVDSAGIVGRIRSTGESDWSIELTPLDDAKMFVTNKTLYIVSMASDLTIHRISMSGKHLGSLTVSMEDARVRLDGESLLLWNSNVVLSMTDKLDTLYKVAEDYSVEAHLYGPNVLCVNENERYVYNYAAGKVLYRSAVSDLIVQYLRMHRDDVIAIDTVYGVRGVINNAHYGRVAEIVYDKYNPDFEVISDNTSSTLLLMKEKLEYPYRRVVLVCNGPEPYLLHMPNGDETIYYDTICDSLFVGCDANGFISLYDRHHARIASEEVGGGGVPYSITTASDGYICMLRGNELLLCQIIQTPGALHDTDGPGPRGGNDISDLMVRIFKQHTSSWIEHGLSLSIKATWVDAILCDVLDSDWTRSVYELERQRAGIDGVEEKDDDERRRYDQSLDELMSRKQVVSSYSYEGVNIVKLDQQARKVHYDSLMACMEFTGRRRKNTDPVCKYYHMQLAPIYEAEDGRDCVVWVAISCGILCGSGELQYYRKDKNGYWYVKHVSRLWVS